MWMPHSFPASSLLQSASGLIFTTPRRLSTLPISARNSVCDAATPRKTGSEKGDEAIRRRIPGDDPHDWSICRRMGQVQFPNAAASAEKEIASQYISILAVP
jgi:hypothetical protein